MLYASPHITVYSLVVTVLLGLVMGSFINCWAWRYINGESIMDGRSHCTTCGHALGVRDLVPVFSWLSTGGKCRYCGDKVSARYPVTEAVCAIVFVAVVATHGLALETVELLAFAGILLFLSLTDLDDYLIPNGCIIAALAVRVAYLACACAFGWMSLGEIGFYAISAFAMGAVLVIVVLIADKAFGRDSMGGGDLKLYFVAGLYFGWQQGLLLVILSCVIGIAVGMLAPRKCSDGSESESLEGESLAQSLAPEEAAHQPTSPEEAAPARQPTSPEEAAPASAKTHPARNPVLLEAEDAQSVEEGGRLRRAFPFGPSIAAACVVVMLVGEPLVSCYLSLL